MKISLGLLNKLFSYERYWCNFFCFMFRDLDLDNKISISRISEGVKFSASVLWNLNFKMGLHLCYDRWLKSECSYLQVVQNYNLCELGAMILTLFPKSTQPTVHIIYTLMQRRRSIYPEFQRLLWSQAPLNNSAYWCSEWRHTKTWIVYFF